MSTNHDSETPDSHTSEGPTIEPTRSLDLGELREDAAVQAPADPNRGGAAIGSSASDRVIGYDIARFVAFVGMIFVNYRVVLDLDFNAPGPEWLESFLGFFPGRAAGLFVLLAGVGVTLMAKPSPRSVPDEQTLRSGRAPRRQPLLSIFRHGVLLLFLGVAALIVGFQVFESTVAGRLVADLDLDPRIDAYISHLEEGGMQSYLIGLGAALGLIGLAFAVLGRRLGHPAAVLSKRALFLFAVGYVWFPLWSGDILHFYGVFLLLGAALVWLRAPWNIGIAVLVVAGSLVWQFQNDFLEHWILYLLEYKEPWAWESVLRSLFFNGWHPVFPWAALFLVGLAVGRVDSRRPMTWLMLLLVGASLVAGARLGGPRLAEYFADRHDAVLAEAFPTDLSSAGFSASGELVKDGEGRARQSRARIPLRVDDGLDGQRFEKQIADIRRLRELLRSDREGSAYPELQLALEPEGADSDRAVAVIQLAHDSSEALPKESEAEFDELRGRIAAWMDDRASGFLKDGRGAGEFSLTRRWPGGLDRVRLERLVPGLAESGDVELRADRSFTVQRSQLADLGDSDLRLRRQFGLQPWPYPGPFFIFDAIGTSLIAIALCLALGSRRWLRKLLTPFAAGGRMALTLYLGHIILGLAVIEWMGMLDSVNLQFIFVASLGFALFGVVFAMAWTAFFRLGPLEALMRWMTR